MGRIHIVGGSGSGKSTLGLELAARLHARFVDLDDLYWEPGWTQVGHEELARRVAPEVAQDSWVIAGNYFATSEAQIWPRVTQVVILDLPYPVLLWRCLRRTLARGLSGATCCNGNRESVWRLFQHDGVVRYLTRTWRRRRARYATLASDAALAHAEVVHLTSRRAVREWRARPIALGVTPAA